MDEYAQIIIDIPAADLNQVFDYYLPENIREKIKIGQVVQVPFGPRRVLGFIIGFTTTPDVEVKKIKPIDKIILDTPLFDENMLELIKWTATYYRSYLINVIKTVIPTGVISGQVGKKKVRMVRLAIPIFELKNQLEKMDKRAVRQKQILEIILANGPGISASELARNANTSKATVNRLVEKGLLEYYYQIEDRNPLENKELILEKPLTPTPGQLKIIKGISECIENDKSEIFLLHGVTGSGKTEVYLQIIDKALQLDKGAIILVPEISLTPMMVNRFYRRFGKRIAVLHSNLSLGERYDEWRRLKEGSARIAIGARSAIFAPIKDLGIIIIDEEHENTYKQGESPYYHTRQVAMKRGKIQEAPVLLGSATPSIESYYYAQEGRFKYLKLSERINQEQMPPVKIIDMREELKKGNTSIFSSDLQEAISQTLEAEQQVLIFLNRRGYANFMLCRECGHVIRCSNCDISLTYHAHDNNLHCHYCNYSQVKPIICPKCGSKFIKEFGIGTERIEEELKKYFPRASIDRMDVDTTTRKGSHQKILSRLEKGETDILVGTQMIAKGHDYPNISLVGVITADNLINIPDFRAAERTFQLLTQVAGRTGRGSQAGRVIVQTYLPEHYSIEAARKHDFTAFFNQEIEIRKHLFYPPYSKLVNIIIQGYVEKEVIEFAGKLGSFLEVYRKYIANILGPSPAPINRLRKRYRWQIILKFTDWGQRHHVLNEMDKNFLANRRGEVSFLVDVDPIKML